jgi:hypothetical protein
MIQGGLVNTAATGTTVTFNASFTKQCLLVMLQPVGSGPTDPHLTSVTVDDFVVNHGGGGSHNYYWFAIGV